MYMFASLMYMLPLLMYMLALLTEDSTGSNTLIEKSVTDSHMADTETDKIVKDSFTHIAFYNKILTEKFLVGGGV